MPQLRAIDSPAIGLAYIAGEWSNGPNIVRVQLTNYRDNPVVDIRLWHQEGDLLKPTDTGIAFHISHLADLAIALDEALFVAIEAGLISPWVCN